jgi:hypothetical protein
MPERTVRQASQEPCRGEPLQDARKLNAPWIICHMSKIFRKSLIIGSVLVAAACALSLAVGFFYPSDSRGAGVPRGIRVGKVVEDGMQSSLMHRFGYIIYELHEGEARNITGLGYFEGKLRPRSRDYAIKYRPWRRTPGAGTPVSDGVAKGGIDLQPLGGLDCDRIQSAAKGRACEALTKPGSYYTSSPVGYGLIVTPSDNSLTIFANDS